MLADVILEFMGRTAPLVAGFIWCAVIVHRTKVDCMRTCERVHEEMRRLARRLDDEEPPSPPPPPPEPVPEPPAALPVARVHRR